MNSRERVLATLEHKEPDRIPLDLGGGHCCKFTKYFYLKLLDYFGIKDEEPLICTKHYQLVYASDKVLDLLGTDIRPARLKLIPQAVSPYAREWEDENNYYYANDFGSTYRMPKAQGLYYDLHDAPLKDAETEEDDAKYVWPVPPKFDPAGRKEMEDYLAAGYSTHTSEQFGNGFLQTGPLIWGFDKWLLMLATEPERCSAFNDRHLENKLKYYDNFFEVYDGLIDITTEADDLGAQNGTFVSPKMTREMIMPYHKKLNEYIKKKYNTKRFLHTCGSVYDVLPDIIESGYDVVNPVQISACNMSPKGLKDTFGKDITFWGGGINTQSTLPFGTPAQVRDEVKRNIDTFAPGGGYVFSSVHNVQDDVPIENFIAMWEAYKDNCKY